jgi:hypothetical protein
MTKQIYIVPRIKVVELKAQQSILAASEDTGSSNVGSGSAGDDTEDLSIGRRGTWGDLWG